MDTPDTSADIEMALDITRRMYELAIRGEWFEMLELDRTRQPSLARLREAPPAAGCVPLMRELLSRNEQLLTMCARAQVEMRKAMQTAGRGRLAARAYSRA